MMRVTRMSCLVRQYGLLSRPYPLQHAWTARTLSSSSSSSSSGHKATPGSNNNNSDDNDDNGNPKQRRIWTKEDVETAALQRRRHEEALRSARWASSWMMPWERAQMDAPVRPLKLWERVYWRLFVVLGGVGFAYETWVLGNRRVLLGDSAGFCSGGGSGVSTSSGDASGVTGVGSAGGGGDWGNSSASFATDVDGGGGGGGARGGSLHRSGRLLSDDEVFALGVQQGVDAQSSWK